jgi:hypothetical protein
VADLARRIQGEELPPPWQPGEGGPVQLGRAPDLGAMLPILLVSVGLMLSRLFGRFIGAGLGGTGAGLATLSIAGIGEERGIRDGITVDQEQVGERPFLDEAELCRMGFQGPERASSCALSCVISFRVSGL